MKSSVSGLLTIPDLKKRNNILWLNIPIVVFAILLVIVVGFKINQDLFYRINSLSGITGTDLWQNLTILGDGLISALILAFWIKKRPEMLWAFLLATIFYMIVLHSLKEGISIKRPPAILEEGSYYLAGKAYKHNAFPSGHATTIFALCGVISFYYKTYLPRITALFAALLIGISRIMIGVHWPADVLAGAILGWSSAYFGIFLAKKIKLKYNKIFKYIFSVLLIISSVVVITGYDTGYDAATFFQILLSIMVISYLIYLFLIDKLKNLKKCCYHNNNR